MPKIHINQFVYEKLKELAEEQNRSISNMAETILYNVWGKQPADKSFVTEELRTKLLPKKISEATPLIKPFEVKSGNVREVAEKLRLDKDIEFCKHDQVKGLCKKGCK